MRVIASVLILALTLLGCGGGVNTTPLVSTTLPNVTAGPPASIVALTGNALLGTLGGASVIPLFAATQPGNQGTIAFAFWGTKDPVSGNIQQVVEAQAYRLAPPSDAFHLFFNSVQLPELVRDDVNGYSLAIAYPSATSLVVTLCDASSNAIMQATATTANGVASSGTVSEGGSCAVPTSVPSLAELLKVFRTVVYVAAVGIALTEILRALLTSDPLAIASVALGFAMLAYAMKVPGIGPVPAAEIPQIGPGELPPDPGVVLTYQTPPS